MHISKHHSLESHCLHEPLLPPPWGEPDSHKAAQKLRYFLINNLEALDSLFKIEMFNRLFLIHIFFIFYAINKSMKAGFVPNHILNKIPPHTNFLHPSSPTVNSECPPNILTQQTFHVFHWFHDFNQRISW